MPENEGTRTKNTVDTDAYLKRIGYHGSLKPDLQTLRALHAAHSRAVPFENLDVALKRPIVLDLERIFDKVVLRRRGGICYELNALFGALLSALGFEVQILSAESFVPKEASRSEIHHMLLVVRLDQRWIADVGFGVAFHEPILLDETRPQRDRDRLFRLERDGDHRVLWMRMPGRPWEKMYRFTLQPRSLEEYAEMCRSWQSAPESYFVKNRVCSLPTPDGCVTLFNDWLIITTNGRRQTHPLRSKREFYAKLREHFGIVLPVG